MSASINPMSASMDLALHKEYAPIYGKDKSGKTRIWKSTVFSVNGSDRAIAVIQHGVYQGKLQIDTREYAEGKNKGKKNETTPLEQCVAETEKKRRDKIEKESYSETFGAVLEECSSQRKIFPMLANKYEPGSGAKKRQGIVYPCFVQPKLDGLRCVVYLDTASRLPVYQSRTGGIFTALKHLDKSILSIFQQNPKIILDGELYTKEIPFEELAGIIKKKTLSEEDQNRIQCVQYHVYDIVDTESKYSDRYQSLQNILGSASRQIQNVPTHLVASVAEFREKFGEFVEAGYEGIMLRNVDGLYRENYRSNDLLKYKEFFESEYPIMDYKEATGRDTGTVIWECETPEGRRFSVRPRGTLELRKRWFQDAKSIVGKQLTVIYQELSEMGVPRFPVGKAIRDGY